MNKLKKTKTPSKSKKDLIKDEVIKQLNDRNEVLLANEEMLVKLNNELKEKNSCLNYDVRYWQNIADIEIDKGYKLVNELFESERKLNLIPKWVRNFFNAY